MNLVSKIDEHIEKKRKISPHPLNRASEAAHPCERYLVLARTKTELMVMPSVELQRVFLEGNIHEDAVLRLLSDAGVKIQEQQRSFLWREYELSGHVDAMVVDENGNKIPLEIKSASPNAFLAVKKLKPMELLKSKYTWQRKYPGQLILYMLMSNSERGILLFKNKASGELFQMDFELNDETLEYAEKIIQKLERVNKMVREGVEPPVVRIEECRGCPFEKTACFPGLDFGPGYDFIEENSLVEKLERWKELKEAAEEFAALDKEIKEALKGKNAVIGGRWLVETKTFQRTGFDIPPEIKEKFKKTQEYQVVKIEEL